MTFAGQELEFTGIVVRSFAVRDFFISSVSTGSQTFEVVFGKSFHVGTVVKVKGALSEYSGKIQVKADSVIQLEDQKNSVEAIQKTVEEKISLEPIMPLLSDALIEKMLPKIQETAKKILSAKLLNRFVILRFHGDADGISGALALTKICKMQAFQQNSAIYSVGEAMRDLQLLHHEFLPIVILLDFGSGPESKEGLKLLKASGAEVIVIDHHPMDESSAKSFGELLNPWMFSNDPDSSKYPAGYLAIEVARLCGVKNAEEYASVACAGDKSIVLPVTQADKDKALVLDYMASYSGFGNNLDFYSSVMSKEELFESMLFQAKEKVDQIFETVRKTLKEKEVNGVKIAVIDLERISVKHEFPSKGKIATRIFESINSDAPLVVLGYSEKSVIFRVNHPAVERGVYADKIISELKSTMKDFIESGGGHAKAAALRVKGEYAKDIVEEIVKIIEKTIATR